MGRRAAFPVLNFDRVHACAALGCKRQAPVRAVFCNRCWAWLARETQIELYATFTREQPTRRFLAAVRRARHQLAPHFAQIDLFDSLESLSRRRAS